MDTCGIDYSSYFIQDAELIVVSESDSDYSPDATYSEPINIKVRISGGEQFFRKETNQISISEKVYKTLYPVKLKDILNGQTVETVKTVYELDGSLAYYKAYVG